MTATRARRKKKQRKKHRKLKKKKKKADDQGDDLDGIVAHSLSLCDSQLPPFRYSPVVVCINWQ